MVNQDLWFWEVFDIKEFALTKILSFIVKLKFMLLEVHLSVVLQKWYDY